MVEKMFRLYVKNVYDVWIKKKAYKRECNAINTAHKTYRGFSCKIEEE